MLPALATVRQLEARLGLDPDSLSGGELQRAQAALEDASALVRFEAQLDWYDADTETLSAPDAVVRVVLGVAHRAYTNPNGVVQETVGPFSRRLSESSGAVYLTDAELAIIRRFRTVAAGLWTLATRRDELSNGTVWYYDSFGLEPFPLASLDDGVWPA